MDNSLDFTTLIGIPYAQLNCWELAREFYKRMFGIELKHYYEGSDTPNRDETRNLIYTNVGDFVHVKDNSEAKFGDLILIRLLGVESHIGIYIGEGRFLHTNMGSGSVLDRLARWEKSIVGFYRIKEGTKIC